MNIEFNLETALPLTLSLYNQMGQLVYQKIQPQPQSGYQRMIIDTDNMNAGVYNLKVDLGENDLQRKIVIIK